MTKRKKPAPIHVTTVRMPADLLKALTKQAEKHGVSRSHFMIHTLRKACNLPVLDNEPDFLE